MTKQNHFSGASLAEAVAKSFSRLQARSNLIVEQLEDFARSYTNGHCHLRDVQP